MTIPTGTPRRTFVRHVMGMPVSVLIRGPDARGARAEAAVALVYAELARFDAIFSTYRPSSEVSRLRSGELGLADCTDDVRTVLALCEAARRDTDGWFDHELPGPGGKRVIDPTGLVKGWATERAAQALASLDNHDWLVNAGGDVVVNAAESPFSVGIQAPEDRGELIDVVVVRRGGIATSGSYARGAHIVNPHSLHPTEHLASVTVVGPSLLIADVLATAVYAEGVAGLDRVERTAGVEALMVLRTGYVLTTSGWRGRRRPPDGRRSAHTQQVDDEDQGLAA